MLLVVLTFRWLKHMQIMSLGYELWSRSFP